MSIDAQSEKFRICEALFCGIHRRKTPDCCLGLKNTDWWCKWRCCSMFSLRTEFRNTCILHSVQSGCCKLPSPIFEWLPWKTSGYSLRKKSRHWSTYQNTSPNTTLIKFNNHCYNHIFWYTSDDEKNCKHRTLISQFKTSNIQQIDYIKSIAWWKKPQTVLLGQVFFWRWTNSNLNTLPLLMVGSNLEKGLFCIL